MKKGPLKQIETMKAFAQSHEDIHIYLQLDKLMRNVPTGKLFIRILRSLDKPERFAAIFTRETHFYNLLFALLQSDPLSEKGLL